MRVGIAVLGVFCVAAAAAAAERVEFDRDIRPILSDRCFNCHGPGQKHRKADLRLDTALGPDGAYRIHEGTTALKPKDLEASSLWYRITTTDEDDAMPPKKSLKKRLTAAEQELFKRWILEGAEYQDFWAFVPPSISEPGKLENRSWSSGRIDDYVLANLEKKKLRPGKEADKRTLIRRLTFDLTGLPPTLEEIDAFLSDKSPEAYDALIDRLLARPQYGEHMARYWADLVRLADSNGMHKDFYRNFVAYRDWLIRSFNDNLGFDDFIKYQLAGDLYAEPTKDQLVASGFNRLHLIIDRGTALPEESLHKNVLDRVATFGTAFLGMTVQCAQCHDHKYDPISQKEFYQVYAFFNNFDGEPETAGVRRGLQKPFIDLITPEQERKLAELQTEEESLAAKLKAAKESEKSGESGESGESEESGESGESEESGKISELEKLLKKVRKEKDATKNSVLGAMVMKERADPRPSYILTGGAYDSPGKEVQRGTPAFLPPLKTQEGVYSRLDLAEWLVDPAHPLTARVAVNRIWQQFFGVGLVKTSEDFGAQGESPSHPQLLDYLAARFVESGWDLKQLVREIASSQTYRQSSDADPQIFLNDPDNRQLARGSRYRLDAEMIRDQLLAVSGKLNTRMYGESVKPPQPAGLWKSVSMIGETYSADKGDAIYRRSFYSFWKRSMPPPQMTIMNAPSREFCLTRRERTNTPLLALLLMNEPEYFRLAGACAERVLEESGGDQDRGLKRLYETLTSQVPDAGRLKMLSEALDEFITLYKEDPALAASLAGDRFEDNPDKRAELAGWTMLTHSLLNIDLTRVRR